MPLWHKYVLSVLSRYTSCYIRKREPEMYEWIYTDISTSGLDSDDWCIRMPSNVVSVSDKRVSRQSNCRFVHSGHLILIYE